MTVLTPPSQFGPLLPPLSVKPSRSVQRKESILDRLNETPLPDKEINAILNLHDSLTFQEVMDRFEVIATKMMRWLETAQMAVYTLEQHVKEDAQDMQDMHPLLDLAVGRMEPLLAALVELGDIIQDKYDDGHSHDGLKRMKAKITITKIQSEWSGLQQYFISVKKQVDSAYEKKELLIVMERVLQQIDDLSTMIFLFQERRHGVSGGTHAMPSDTTVTDPTHSPLSTCSGHLFSPSTTSTTTAATTLTTLTANTHWSDTNMRNDQILVDIDSRVEPLFNDVQRIYASMTSTCPPEDPSGILNRKHTLVQERWECLRIEIDDLKDELKEDRWLTVFRQVADQVDAMIEGLEKAVNQCLVVVQQARDWHAAYRAATPPTPPIPGNVFDRVSKPTLRSSSRSHPSISSSASASASGYSIPPPAVDRQKLLEVEKKFDDKYKLYALSVSKMLTMLGNGIVARVAQDSKTIHRHEAMVHRWEQLKTSMDNLWHYDLPDADKILVLSQRNTSNWKTTRYRTTEQGNTTTSRPRTPKSSTLPKTLSGTQNDSAQNVNRRVRSVTPNSSEHHRQQNTLQGRQIKRAASSMAHMRDSYAHTMRTSSSDSSSIDIAPRSLTAQSQRAPSRAGHAASDSLPPWSQDRPTNGVTRRKSRVPAPPAVPDRDEISWMKPTKSTIMRTQRTRSVDSGSPGQTDLRPKTPVMPVTPVMRSKTPNPGASPRKSITPRPKSSMGQQPQSLLLPPPSRQQQTASPVRRTMTPSMIPRPKTPSDRSSLWGGAPSLIPRPQSAMQQHATGSSPPLPPLPSTVSRAPSSQVVVSSNDAFPDSHPITSSFLSVRDSSPQPPPPPSVAKWPLKKHSMPALTQRSASPFRQTHGSIRRSPSPPPRQARHFSVDEGVSADSHRAQRRGSRSSTAPGPYIPHPGDPLDVQIAQMINASPVPIYCQKAPQGGGKYYFGNALNPALGGGRRLYTCKLMEYTDRRTAGHAKVPHSKVLVRVGGGWEELQMFLLEHVGLFV